MNHGTRDAPGLYHTGHVESVRRLRFDRGTLLLEGVAELPAGLDVWFQYDPRVDAYRAPAHCYSAVIGPLKGQLAGNRAPRYQRRELVCALEMTPYPHQQEALAAWQAAQGRGVVALPTGAGKTLVGLLALRWAQRDGLVLVPTLDLMQQWYALLRAAFPDQEIGLIGGGYHEPQPLTIATYDSAARHIERLGDRFGLLIFDEAHHLPSGFYRVIAEFSLAPYRLGLTATPERSDGRDADLPELIGPIIYRKRPEQLAGGALAEFQLRTIHVDLAPAERTAYQQALDERNAFLQAQQISLGTLEGWNRFVMRSARSSEGRRAMLAHRTARRIAHATPAKLRTLDMILANHPGAKTVIFTEDNATAYELSQRFLIPCLSHQTAVKERQTILDLFKTGVYMAIVASNVLNEGVDVPDASVGVILSGSASVREFIQRLGRILRRGEGKKAVLYEVIARETREERVAERRRNTTHGSHEQKEKEGKALVENTKDPVSQQSLWDNNPN